jgi:hypothetical protein
METTDQIRPNDVAIVLRPDYQDSGKWEGNYQVLISGFGPFTLPEENVRELIGVAMLLASTVSLIEKDVSFAEKLMDECSRLYCNPQDIDINELNNNFNDEDFVLSSTSKTYGGMQ